MFYKRNLLWWKRALWKSCEIPYQKLWRTSDCMWRLISEFHESDILFSTETSKNGNFSMTGGTKSSNLSHWNGFWMKILLLCKQNWLALKRGHFKTLLFLSINWSLQSNTGSDRTSFIQTRTARIKRIVSAKSFQYYNILATIIFSQIFKNVWYPKLHFYLQHEHTHISNNPDNGNS